MTFLKQQSHWLRLDVVPDVNMAYTFTLYQLSLVFNSGLNLQLPPPPSPHMSCIWIQRDQILDSCFAWEAASVCTIMLNAQNVAKSLAMHNHEKPICVFISKCSSPVSPNLPHLMQKSLRRVVAASVQSTMDSLDAHLTLFFSRMRWSQCHRLGSCSLRLSHDWFVSYFIPNKELPNKASCAAVELFVFMFFFAYGGVVGRGLGQAHATSAFHRVEHGRPPLSWLSFAW